MFATNLKVAAVVLGTLVAYTLLANMIPQVESDAPRQVAFTEDMAPEELVAIGEEIYRGAGGCVACHDTGERAPALRTGANGAGPIGVRCAERVPGMSCRDYIYESLVNPNAYPVQGYPAIMPDARRTLSEPQILTLVAFLEDQGGEVTVTAAEVVAAQEGEGDPAAAPGPAAAAGIVGEPEVVVREQCLICHELGDEGTAIGPSFDGIGARRDAEFLRRKILDPGFEVSEGYEATAGIMPTTFGEQFTAAQLEAVVRYLTELR
jgi:mono/diheme cytochrome c family protein